MPRGRTPSPPTTGPTRSTFCLCCALLTGSALGGCNLDAWSWAGGSDTNLDAAYDDAFYRKKVICKTNAMIDRNNCCTTCVDRARRGEFTPVGYATCRNDCLADYTERLENCLR